MFSGFPHPPTVQVGDLALEPEAVIEFLAPYLSERRRQRIDQVVANRTFSVVPVIEGAHDLGNANAVMRSAEGLGFAAAHLAALEGDAATWAARRGGAGALPAGTGAAQRQSQGADKWLELHIWDDVVACTGHLRRSGYRIAATHLARDAVPIVDVDFTIPTAIVFGNESEGVSGAVLAEADLNLVLPVDGFIQSYNVSVAAALALYHARLDRISRLGIHGDLDERQRRILTAVYYVRATRNATALLREAGAGEGTG